MVIQRVWTLLFPDLFICLYINKSPITNIDINTFYHSTYLKYLSTHEYNIHFKKVFDEDIYINIYSIKIYIFKEFIC